MKRVLYDAIGVLEVNFYANAIYLLDAMEKAANIKFLTAEKFLGGRMVTLIIGGTVSDVKAAIDTAKDIGEGMEKNPVKVGIAISNPSPEIMKYVDGGLAEEADK